MTEMEITRDAETNDIVFKGRISMSDYEDADFDELDLAVINSPAIDMADWLQSLQIIAFRIRQKLEIIK